MKLWEVLPEFANALEQQLRKDDIKWGDTWLKRTRKGQEERTIATFNDYFDGYIHAGHPINWLAVAGCALICWYREQHSEIWTE